MCTPQVYVGALTQWLPTGQPLHFPLHKHTETHDVALLRRAPTLSCVLQLTWLLDDAGVPANWRALEGHSVNTYTMINSEGKERYIKLIWAPKGGAWLLAAYNADPSPVLHTFFDLLL
jgi:hypothetical protein